MCKTVGIKAELFKYRKRKIYIIIIGLLIVPVLYAFASVLKTNPFAQSDQSLCYWLGNVMLMNSIMYVTPIIFAYVSCLNLASEIENQHLGMLVQRVGDRKRVYKNKVASNIIVLTLIFILQIIGCTVIYYIAYILGAIDVTGTVWGAGYNLEGIVLLMEVYVFYCLLLPFIINGLSLIITSNSKIMILFIIIIFMTRMLPSNVFTSHVMPWNILKQMSITDTTPGGNDLTMSFFNLLNAGIISCCIGSVFYQIGKVRIRKIIL